MKEKIKPSVKELYGSVRAPEALRQRTLAAIENGDAAEKKAKILEINFKALGAIAACVVIFFGLVFLGMPGEDSINISVGGISLTDDAVICSVPVEYLPQALPLSVGSTDGGIEGDALVLDVEFDGKAELEVIGATPAVKNSQGQLCEISQNAEIDGGSALYLITNGAAEIEVTFTSDREVKTLVIHENSDGTFSVGIK